jgi:deoxyribose-phosphate aldolase
MDNLTGQSMRRNPFTIANLIDYTLLKPEATKEQIAEICEEARRYEFAAVCVNPIYVKQAAQLLRDSPVKVCTVVGFPLGATLPDVKAYEARRAIEDGAQEIDMVICIGALKSRDYDSVRDEIEAVVRVCHERGAILKVIIETGLLTEEEKVKACELAKASGADYIKTSTGFGPSGATVEDVALMRSVVGKEMGVKASGGIRTFQKAKAMIEAGATRIGASAGVKIVEEAKAASHS